MTRRVVSLRWLVPLVLVVLAAAYVLITFGYLIPAAQKRSEERSRLELTHDLANLQGTLETFFRMGNLDGVRRLVAAASTDPETKWLVVADDHGTVIATTDFRWLGQPLTDIGLPIDDQVVTAVQHSQALGTTVAKNQRMLIGYGRVALGTKIDEVRSFHSGAIILAMDLEVSQAETNRQALKAVSIVAVLILIGIAMVGVLFHVLLTRRVTDLLRTVRALADGELAARSRVSGQDEIGALGASFDRMAEMLQTRVHQIEASESRFRSLFDNSPVALWEEDFSAVKMLLDGLAADGVSDLKPYLDAHPEVLASCGKAVAVIAVNQSAVQLHRATDKDQLLSNLPRTFNDNSYKDFERELVAIFNGEVQLEIESEVLTLDGDIRYVTVLWAVPPGFEHSYEKVLVSLIDITEAKRAEMELNARTEALERSNAELEQFAYVASHDLREPLRMVNSYMDLLKRRYGEHLEPEAHEFIAFAKEGAVRMDHLVQDLLEFSRVGRLTDPLMPVSTGVLAEKAISTLKEGIDEADASVELSADLPEIVCSGGEITRLFQNLIGNALKFRNPDRPPAIKISCRRDDKFWRFAVTDNGIGIEPTYFERIFMIFQRLHTRDKYEGTGIGLAICKKIVERHGGRIWVESIPGEGSTFLFTLPDGTSAPLT